MSKIRMLKRLTLLFFVSYALTNCQKEIVTPNGKNNYEVLSDDYIEFSNNSATLEQRTKLINEVLILGDGQPRGRNKKEEKAVWVQVAEVSTLDIDGQTLSATHVQFIDDVALVSYHKHGDVHLGAIEIINLIDPSNPYISDKIVFKQADVNSIAFDSKRTGPNRKIWLALSDKRKGAVLGELQIDRNGKFTSQEIKLITLSDYLEGDDIASSANAVVRAKKYIYVTAGKSHGGTFCFKSDDFSFVGHSSYSNAKYVAYNGKEVVSLQTGENASLKIEKPGGFSFEETYPIGKIGHQNVELALKGKNTIYFDDKDKDIAYVAGGTLGLIAVDLKSGTSVNTPDAGLTNGNTNGLTTDKDYLYLANGADGLTIFSMPVVNEANPATFHWDLNESEASANYVATNNEWVFVAKGKGGLKILKRPKKDELLPLGTFNSRGKPDNLAPDQDVCEQIYDDIFDRALPERVDAILNRPDLFSKPNQKILLQESSSVYLTFLHEGAGYLNTLGFYYYDKDNPPSSVEELTRIIIFPNASAVNSGGELIPGNTMKVLGNFPENTVIEFFLIPDGFRHGKIREGNGTIYTNRAFNKNNSQQTLFLYDKACKATILSIEDIALPGGDRDYNDVIFQISTSKSGALNTEDFITI